MARQSNIKWKQINAVLVVKDYKSEQTMGCDKEGKRRTGVGIQKVPTRKCQHQFIEEVIGIPILDTLFASKENVLKQRNELRGRVTLVVIWIPQTINHSLSADTHSFHVPRPLQDEHLPLWFLQDVQ